jgi:formylglycine-generating enzyme
MRARGLVLVAVASLPSCSPRSEPAPGQILLYIDTDAPIVTSSGLPATTNEPIPLFDRLRIDATGPGGSACGDCSREFDATEEMFRGDLVSFGLLAALSGGTVRARLFRSAGSLTGEPNSDATVDVTATIPTVAATGVTSMTLFLPTEETGTPVTGAAMTTGAPNPSKAGSWPGARRQDCRGTPETGEVCIPGGAYWMGNPHAFYGYLIDGNRQRIAVMSPFFIDAAEVTVAAYRKSGLAPGAAWSGVHTGQVTDYCTFTESEGPYDAYPVNCVSWEEARAYCRSLGKDLPTEAQYEYVASDLAGDLYPWGSDVPQCPDCVLARAGAGVYELDFGECRTTEWGGSELAGSGARDRVELPTGTVVDLAGNLAEPTLDRWAALTDPCWTRPGVYVEPFCGPAATCSPATELATARGATWAFDAFDATVALRTQLSCNIVTPLQGIRCARPAR